MHRLAAAAVLTITTACLPFGSSDPDRQLDDVTSATGEIFLGSCGLPGGWYELRVRGNSSGVRALDGSFDLRLGDVIPDDDGMDRPATATMTGLVTGDGRFVVTLVADGGSFHRRSGRASFFRLRSASVLDRQTGERRSCRDNFDLTVRLDPWHRETPPRIL